MVTSIYGKNLLNGKVITTSLGHILHMQERHLMKR